MANPITSPRHLTLHESGECLGIGVRIWCPGCEELHMPRFRCPEHGGPVDGTPTWDGDPDSDPFTMSPSYLTRGGRQGPDHVCHSFVKGGQWQFLGDCTHHLAGQTVPLPPLPDWLFEKGDD